MIRKILHKPQALLGLAMMLIVFFVVAFAPFIAPHDPSELNVAHALSAPDSEYPLGTDEMGRCVFSRLLYGARSSMSIALPSLIILALVSTVVATVCAYLGGVLDRIFDVVSNIFMAFPPFLVAITLVGYILFQKQGDVRCVDVAEYLEVTKPSVSRAVKELTKAKYLRKDSSGILSLTSSGEQVAAAVYERHCFFMERLIAAGVDPKTAEADACRMEHGISPEAFEKLRRSIERQGEEVK